MSKSKIVNVEICEVCGVVNYVDSTQLVFWMEDIPKNPTVYELKEFASKVSNDFNTIQAVSNELIRFYSQWIDAEVIVT